MRYDLNERPFAQNQEEFQRTTMGFPSVASDGGILCVIYTTEGGGLRPFHGAYLAGEGEWVPITWTRDGFRSHSPGFPHHLDIRRAVLSGEVKAQEQKDKPSPAEQEAPRG